MESAEKLENCDKSKDEILAEIEANNRVGDEIVKLVTESGNSMSEVDKITVHIKEVESITNLLLVLQERLARIDEDLKISNLDDRVCTP